MKKSKKLTVLFFVFLLIFISSAIVAFSADTKTEAQKLLSEIAQTPPTLSADGKTVILPQISNEDYEVSIYGSSNTSVIDTDGNVYTPLVDTEVSIMYKVTSKADETDFAVDNYKEAKILIKGKYQASAEDNAEPQVLPKLREWKGGTGFLKITEDTQIVVVSSRFSETAARAQEYLKAITGFDMEIAVSSDFGPADIVLCYVDSPELGEEGYTIEIGESITICAYGKTGALYGATTVAQMLDIYEGFELPKGYIRDYPQYEVRAVMVDVARHYIPMEYLSEMTKYMAYFKVNVMRVHINDTSGQQPYAFRVESKKFPEINANLKGNYYTQEEYRAYQREMLTYGIKVITEIDSPGHAGFVNAYDSTLTAPSSTSLLNLSTDVHSVVNGVAYTYYDKSVEFMKELFLEFIGGDNPIVIDEIDTFHIGMDEYTLDHEQFKVYMKEMTEFVKSHGKKVQVWSALKTADFTEELPIGTDVTVNYWGFADFEKLIEYGYPCVANKPMDLYVVPGGFSNSFGDRISLEGLYKTYEVNNVSTSLTLAPSSPLLRGAEACLWNDSNVAPSLEDLFDRLHDQMLLISEKAWYGKNAEDASVEEFMSRVYRFENRVPGVNPSRFVAGDENGSVAEYDFENVQGSAVKDSKGQYDATLNGLTTVTVNGNTMLKLDGNGYLSLPFDTLGHPYTVSFELIYEGSENGILFGNDESWLKVNFNGTGKLAYKRDLQTYTLPHVFKEGVQYKIMLVCDAADLYLYVNGIFAGKGEIHSMDTIYTNTNYIKFSTLPLPTKYIGKGVVGMLDNLKLSNTAADYNELTGLNLVNYGNVAEGKDVTCSGVEVTTKWGPECAVDGILKADDNNNKTSLNNKNDAWLTVDLGDIYEVEKIVIEFSQRPVKYQFWTSVDGEIWEMVHEESKLAGGSGGTDTVMLNNKKVRYVKYQTVEMFLAGNGYYYSGGFHELMVYSSYYDRSVIERAEALLPSLSNENRVFLETAIELVSHIIENNDYNDVGIALKCLSDACDELESMNITASDVDCASLIGLIKNKKNPEFYSADSYNAYNEAYRFAIATVLDLTASEASVDIYTKRLEGAAFELLCVATVETNMPFDNPQNLLDGNNSTYAVTGSNQTAGDYIIVRYEDTIALKSIKLVMSVGNKYLGASTLYVSYDGEEFVPVTTLNMSLVESNIVIGGDSAGAEIFFPTALYGVKAIKIVVNADTARVAYINEIHVNHVTNLDTLVSGIGDLDEKEYTEVSFKNMLPFTRAMAVSSTYMTRATTFIKHIVKKADLAAISDEIARLEKISPEGYTAHSYARLTSAINAAKGFIASVNSNTDIYEGEAEIEKLRYAEKMLLSKKDGIDTSLLEEAIDRSADSAQYTYYSYKAYRNALIAAINLLYSDGAAQADIDYALSTLNKRYDGLVARDYEENLALGKDVTVSGLESADVDVTKVVDGIDSTGFDYRVSLNGADDAWLTVDLGALYTIDKVSLYWYTQPAKYCVMVSEDGKNWTTVHTNLHCKNVGKQSIDHITFDAVNARYVKFQQILMLVGNAEKFYRYTGNICEMKVFGSDMKIYRTALEERYNELSALDSALMNEECREKHLAALLEAERVLALASPTQQEIDAAEAALLMHSAQSFVFDGANSLEFSCDCGAYYKEDIITLSGAKLNLTENINMIYLFKINGNVEAIKIEFTFMGTKYEAASCTLEADGRYSFRFDRILPQYMGEILNATVYATVDGRDVVASCDGISVKEYAETVLSLYPDDQKLVTLVSDMLVYGAAAQVYAEYKTEELVTEGVAISPSEFSAPSSKLSVEENSAACSILSTGLRLTGDVNLYFTFTAEQAEGLFAKISINGRESVYKVSELTPSEDGIYKIYFNRVMANEFDDEVRLTFLLDGKEIGNTVTYSVNSYVAATDTAEATPLANLVKAIACYGASAKAYQD